MSYEAPYALVIADNRATNVRVVVDGGTPHPVPGAYVINGVLHFTVPVEPGSLGGTPLEVHYDNEYRRPVAVRTRIMPVPVAVTARNAITADALSDPARYATAAQMFDAPYAQRLDQHAPAEDTVDLGGQRLVRVGDGQQTSDGASYGQTRTRMQQAEAASNAATDAKLADYSNRAAMDAAIAAKTLGNLGTPPDAAVDAAGERFADVGDPALPGDLAHRGYVEGTSAAAVDGSRLAGPRQPRGPRRRRRRPQRPAPDRCRGARRPAGRRHQGLRRRGGRGPLPRRGRHAHGRAGAHAGPHPRRGGRPRERP